MGAAEVLADSRFMLMIVVYSGFWVLYFQNFGSVLWYLRDFVDGTPVSQAVGSLLQRLGLAGEGLPAQHVAVHAGAGRDGGAAVCRQRPAPRPAAGAGLPHGA